MTVTKVGHPRSRWRRYALVAALAFCTFTTSACSPPDESGNGSDASDGSNGPGDSFVDGGPILKPGDLGILTVTPHRGPVEGGESVDLLGQQFDATTKVYFGEEEAEIDWRSGATHIYVTTPAQAIPGRVDIRLENADGRKAVLAGGYTYIGEVTASQIAPQHGPHTGGTVIEVRGDGFMPGDRVLVGFRECLQSQVIDRNTIVAITPPANIASFQHRQSVLVSVRHASGVTNVPDVFTYGRAPRIDRVAPAVISDAGEPVTLHGRALGNTDRLFAADTLADLSDGTASSSRGAKLPARAQLGASAGPVIGLLADSHFGHGRLDPAYAYAEGSDTLHGVSPAAGSTAGGQEVGIIVETNLDKVSKVTFGGTVAKHAVKSGALVVTTPKHAAGPVDVVVHAAGGKLTKKSAYRFVESVAITSVKPESGPAKGGTSVTIGGSGFGPGCTVRIGIYNAKATESTATSITVTAPPGPLGAADVEVSCGPMSSLARNAYGYTDGKPQINAVSPASGATGGGTLVTVYGSGFLPGMKVYFGGAPATEVATLDSGRLRLKTPSHKPGPVAVDVVYGDQTDTLIDGYVYFSPTQPRGGTYGQPAAGTLNVTVLNIYTLSPIQGAWVQVGQPGTPLFQKYGEYTDDKGQVVFSGPDIAGQLTVSASKKEFSASSIVHFGVGNATLLLFPFVPPSSGPGNPPTGLPAARIEGRVLDLNKYVWVAPNNCLKPSEGGPQCDFCDLPDDCTKTAVAGDTKKWMCVLTGAAGNRCFHTCKSDNDCSKGFGCVPDLTQADVSICKPSHGIRQIRCTTSCRGLSCKEPQTDATPPEAIVDEKTGKFTLDPVRLDELAVACRAGYVANTKDSTAGVKAGEFVPFTMGVKRHLFPQPGETIKNVNVRLNIPLKRTLHVRLDNPPKHFPSKNTPGRIKLQSWLHLGSDGYIPMADVERNPLGKETGIRDSETLFRQPLTLPETLTATTQVYRAVAKYGAETPTTPQSGTLHDDLIKTGDINMRVRSKFGVWSESTLALNTTITAILAGASGSEELLFVARDGRVYRGTLEDPYVIWFPLQLDPYTKPAVILAAAGTPTSATIVGKNGLIRRLDGDTVKQEKGVLAEDLNGVCQGPAGRVVVGAKGGIGYDGGTGWKKAAVSVPGALHAVVCDAKGAIAVGDGGAVVTLTIAGASANASVATVEGGANLRSIVRTGLGQVWAAGDAKTGVGGTILKLISGKWESAWPAGFNPKDIPGLRRLFAIGGGTVLATDQHGGLWRVGPAGVGNESPERRDMEVLCGARTSAGQTILAGRPGLWLGPFLTVPNITKPKLTANPKELEIEWSVAPGPLPSLNRVHLDGQGFPFWWLYTAPKTTSVKLPDYAKLPPKHNVFMPVPYVARIDRIYNPDVTIDGFSTFDVEFGGRRSWSTNYRAFNL